MTVTTTTNVNQFVADGIQTLFNFTFVVQQASDVKVYLGTTEQVAGFVTTPDADLIGGGTLFSGPPANGTIVTLARVLPYTQESDIPAEKAISDTTFEDAFDKLTMLAQQLQSLADRSISVPITNTTFVGSIPTPVPNYLLGANAAGTGLQWTAGTPGPPGPAGSMTGPGTVVKYDIPLYADTTGNVLDKMGGLGAAGQIMTSNGVGVKPSMQNYSGADGINGFRLSLHATNPYPGDITGALSVYSIPYKGNQIALWDSTASKMTAYTSGILTETIAAATHYFRQGFIYEFLNAGVADLEIDWWDSAGQSTKAITLLTIANPCVITCTAHGWNVGDKIGIRRGTAAGTAWTDAAMGLDGKEFYVSAKTTNTLTLEGCDTSALAVTNYTGATAYKIPATPTTAAVRTEGVWFKSGDRTRRLVGAIKTNSAGTIDCSSVSRLNLHNVDNQEIMMVQAVDANASWTSVAVTTTQPRSGSLEMGKARLEFMLAVPQYVDVRNTDSGTGAGSACCINLNRVASEAFGALTIGKCAGAIQYGTGYVATVGVSEILGAFAGSNFVQRMALSNGAISYMGRTFATYPGADSFASVVLMG